MSRFSTSESRRPLRYGHEKGQICNSWLKKNTCRSLRLAGLMPGLQEEQRWVAVRMPVGRAVFQTRSCTCSACCRPETGSWPLRGQLSWPCTLLSSGVGTCGSQTWEVHSLLLLLVVFRVQHVVWSSVAQKRGEEWAACWG